MIKSIAEKRHATPGQVLVSWAIQRGTSVIPKSVNPGRIRQNLDAASLVLTGEDMDAIDGLDRHFRYVTGAFWAFEGGPYTVNGLWDE